MCPGGVQGIRFFSAVSDHCDFHRFSGITRFFIAVSDQKADLPATLLRGSVISADFPRPPPLRCPLPSVQDISESRLGSQTEELSQFSTMLHVLTKHSEAISSDSPMGPYSYAGESEVVAFWLSHVGELWSVEGGLRLSCEHLREQARERQLFSTGIQWEANCVCCAVCYCSNLRTSLEILRYSREHVI